MKNNHVRIPKIGWIKIKQTEDVVGHITSVTITKETTGRYFVSIMTSFEEVWLPDNDSIVVIVPTSDGGFYTSDGRFYRNDFVTDDWLRRLKTAEARQYHLKELAIKAGKPLVKRKIIKSK